MALAALALTPRALTPTSQADEEFSPDHANSPIASLLELYIEASSSSSPESSIHGMMRNTIETGAIGDQNFAMRGPFPGAMPQRLPADQLPGHQARQLTALGHPWQQGRQPGPVSRPPSSISNRDRERSLTSEHSSLASGRPHPRLRSRIPQGRHTPSYPGRQHIPYQTGFAQYRSETDLRRASAGSQGPPYRRAMGRSRGPRPSSPAISEYIPRGGQGSDYAGRSASPAFGPMNPHFDRRNYSMSTLRGGRSSPAIPNMPMHPYVPRNPGPLPGYGHNLQRSTRPRAPSNLSTVSNGGTRSVPHSRFQVEPVSPDNVCEAAHKPTVEYYDYAENFIAETSAGDTFTDEIIESYVRFPARAETPVSTPQGLAETPNENKKLGQQPASSFDIGPEVASPSPQADREVQKKELEKRLSAWAKYPIVNPCTQDTEAELSNAEISPPAFGIAPDPQSSKQLSHLEIIANQGQPEATHVIRETEATLSTRSSARVEETESTGVPMSKEAGHGSGGQDKTSNVKNTNRDPAKTAYRIPSIQFSNLMLSPSDDETDQSLQNDLADLQTPSTGKFNDEPSWTQGFLDLAQDVAGTDTDGGLGSICEDAPVYGDVVSVHVEDQEPTRSDGVQVKANFRRNMDSGVANLYRSNRSARGGYARREVARPESEVGPWAFGNHHGGQQHEYVIGTNILPPRTSSRRRPEKRPFDKLSKLSEEESVGSLRNKNNLGTFQSVSSAGAEAAARQAAHDLAIESKSRDQYGAARLEPNAYDRINEQYPSEEEDNIGTGLDGTGYGRLSNVQRHQMSAAEIPRLEITRATGSTGRSLTHSDDSMLTRRPLSQRLKDHIASAESVLSAANRDDQNRKRLQVVIPEDDSSIESGGFPPAQRDGAGSSAMSSNNALPIAQARLVQLASTENSPVLLAMDSNHIAARKPNEIQKAIQEEVKAAKGGKSMAFSTASNSPKKNVSFSTALDKQGKSAMKTRIKSWLSKRGLWKSGKARSGGGLGRSQSDHVVGV